MSFDDVNISSNYLFLINFICWGLNHVHQHPKSKHQTSFTSSSFGVKQRVQVTGFPLPQLQGLLTPTHIHHDSSLGFFNNHLLQLQHKHHHNLKIFTLHPKPTLHLNCSPTEGAAAGDNSPQDQQQFEVILEIFFLHMGIYLFIFGFSHEWLIVCLLLG